MTPDTPPIIREQEASKLQYQKEAGLRLQKLLASNVSLLEIADILDAQEFISVIEAERGKAPVVNFDAKAFIDREVAKEYPLQLPTDLKRVARVFLPPDSGELQTGSGEGMESKSYIPRSRYLVELLTELGEPYSVEEGVNSPNMFRSKSYRAFKIPRLEKIVFVNDESNNVTFVIHQVVNTDTEVAEYSKLTKNELRALGESRVTTLVYHKPPELWKMIVERAITTSPVVQETTASTTVKDSLLPGWLSRHALACMIANVSPNTVKVFLDRLTKDNPTLVVRKGATRYYDPVCLEFARKHFEGRRVAPPGSMTLNTLASVLRRDYRTTKQIVLDILTSHPEWEPETYNDIAGHPQLHYPKELVDDAMKHAVPEGSISIRALAALVGRSYQATEQVARRIGAHDKTLLIESGEKISFCTPLLIARVQEFFAERRKAPQAWVVESVLLKLFPEFKVTDVKAHLPLFIREHPEFAPQDYDDSAGVLRPHFSLDLFSPFRDFLETRVPKKKHLRP